MSNYPKPIKSRVDLAADEMFGTFAEASPANADIVKLMKHDTYMPTADQVADFCRYHRVSADWLFGKSDMKTPVPSVSPSNVIDRLGIASGNQCQKNQAKKTGLFQSEISAVERGVRPCSIKVACAFADAYGKSYDWMFGIPFEEGKREEEEKLDAYVLYRGERVCGCFLSLEEVADYIGCNVRNAKLYSQPRYKRYEAERVANGLECNSWIIEKVQS